MVRNPRPAPDFDPGFAGVTTSIEGTLMKLNDPRQSRGSFNFGNFNQLPLWQGPAVLGRSAITYCSAMVMAGRIACPTNASAFFPLIAIAWVPTLAASPIW